MPSRHRRLQSFQPVLLDHVIDVAIRGAIGAAKARVSDRHARHGELISILVRGTVAIRVRPGRIRPDDVLEAVGQTVTISVDTGRIRIAQKRG